MEGCGQAHSIKATAVLTLRYTMGVISRNVVGTNMGRMWTGVGHLMAHEEERVSTLFG